MSERVMPERCPGCAYRPGTEASRSKATQTAARLCVLAAVPFHCHMDPAAATGEEPALCRGFAEALQVRLGSAGRGWQAQVAAILLEVMEQARDGDLTEEEGIAVSMERIRALRPIPPAACQE